MNIPTTHRTCSLSLVHGMETTKALPPGSSWPCHWHHDKLSSWSLPFLLSGFPTSWTISFLVSLPHGLSPFLSVDSNSAHASLTLAPRCCLLGVSTSALTTVPVFPTPETSKVNKRWTLWFWPVHQQEDCEFGVSLGQIKRRYLKTRVNYIIDDHQRWQLEELSHK